MITLIAVISFIIAAFIAVVIEYFSVLQTVGAGFMETQQELLASEFVVDLQWIALVLTVGLILVMVVLYRRMRRLTEKIAAQQEVAPSEPAMGGPLKNRWEEIMRHIDSPREGEWKFAIIEADKLVDDQLKTRFAGETMGERLMNIDKTKLLTIDGLWEAHKVRNRLAHDTNYFLRHAEAVRAIRLFEQTLKELEAI